MEHLFDTHFHLDLQKDQATANRKVMKAERGSAVVQTARDDGTVQTEESVGVIL